MARKRLAGRKPDRAGSDDNQRTWTGPAFRFSGIPDLAGKGELRDDSDPDFGSDSAGADRIDSGFPDDGMESLWDLPAPGREQKRPGSPDEGKRREGPESADQIHLYLRDICRLPLLTATEEKEVARRIYESNLAAEILDAGRMRRPLSEDAGKFVLRRMPSRKSARHATSLRRADRLMRRLSPDRRLSIEELKRLLKRGDDARRRLSEANLRLVVSIARRYSGRGLSLSDLIQEGNLGLLRAVEKFDYSRGFKFSTYATWWIRHAITRALADQGRTIRIPMYMIQNMHRMSRAAWRLQQELGRDPSPEEVAERAGLPADLVLAVSKSSSEPISLELPTGKIEGNVLKDLLEDHSVPEPDYEIYRNRCREELLHALRFLSRTEREVLTLRFGLADGRRRTLEEISHVFGVTRERIRQIENKALRKLRHPERNRKLRDYLDS